MAVLKDSDLADICSDFTDGDLDRKLDLAYGHFGDFLDTIEYLKFKLKNVESGQEMREFKRKALIVEH